MIIYKTTNLINGKIYIGKDAHNNPNYLGSGRLLKQAIAKHGVENFTKEIIEECTSENIDEREIYWISYFNSCERGIGYNLTEGGTGGDTFTLNPNKEKTREKLSQKSKGRRHTEEAKRKVSEARKGKGNGMYGKAPWNKGISLSDETKRKLSEANKGKRKGIPISEEQKEAISKPQKGRVKSEEHRRKISETLKGTKRDRDAVEKSAEKMRGRKQAILTCPHCGKTGGTTMYRWHFDNCKENHEKKCEADNCNS